MSESASFEETERSNGERPEPFVSVVIPVYNDPEGIRTTLESLVRQTYPRSRHEIIAVDNGSTDETPGVVREFADDHGHVSLVVEDEIQGSYAARNAGLTESKGEIIALIDADMTVERDWLERGVARLEDGDSPYLACSVELLERERESLTAKYDRLTGFPVGEYVERQNYAPTCCLFVRRFVFESVGEFDPRLTSGGDGEFGHRVAASGCTLAFAPDITMYHPTRGSLRSLLKKEFRVGRGICQRQRYYPDRYGKPGVPPRPSGIKSADEEAPTLSTTERLSFAALSLLATAVRGTGYYFEFASFLSEKIRSTYPPSA